MWQSCLAQNQLKATCYYISLETVYEGSQFLCCFQKQLLKLEGILSIHIEPSVVPLQQT